MSATDTTTLTPEEQLAARNDEARELAHLARTLADGVAKGVPVSVTDLEAEAQRLEAYVERYVPRETSDEPQVAPAAEAPPAPAENPAPVASAPASTQEPGAEQMHSEGAPSTET